MTVREMLHDIVDRLDDEQATEALGYLSDLNGTVDAASAERPNRTQAPPMISARRSYLMPKRDWRAIAAEQGVKPIASADELAGDFWPEDEGPDEFVDAVREWRREGGCG